MPTQTTDVYNSSGPGIEYAGPNLTWFVADGVFVASKTSAVLSDYNDSKLVNRGNLIGSGIAGMEFDGTSNLTVVNKSGGNISGGGYGVVFLSNDTVGVTVRNHGEITAILYGIHIIDASDIFIENTGTIVGLTVGIQVQGSSVSATEGALIENSGVIRSASYAILGAEQAGLTMKVVNKADGVIESGDVAIATVLHGRLAVMNKGMIKGDIAAGADGVGDKVVNAGIINGEVQLGSGDDVFKSKGGKAGKVSGEEGNDTLIAGSRKDKFVFDTALDELTNVDRVKRFEPGVDKVYLDLDIFTALTGPGGLLEGEFRKGTAAGDADDRILYDKATGELYYDPDGLGGTDPILFARFDPGTKLTADDFVVIA